MFPLRDHNPTNRIPYVTWGIIALNLGLFLLTAPWAGDLQTLWLRGALYPGAVTNGHWLHGLATHMFLHAGLLHLGGNMLFLWVFGDNMEEQFGHLGFAAFYLAGGLAAAGAQILSEPFSMVPMVGASGAVAAVMGGYLLLFPRARVDVIFFILIFFKVFPVPAWAILGLWFAIQLWSEFGAGDAGVAYWAHIGGFVAGAGLAAPHFLRLGRIAFWRRFHGHPPHPEAVYDRSPVPIVPRRRR